MKIFFANIFICLILSLSNRINGQPLTTQCFSSFVDFISLNNYNDQTELLIRLSVNWNSSYIECTNDHITNMTPIKEKIDFSCSDWSNNCTLLSLNDGFICIEQNKSDGWSLTYQDFLYKTTKRLNSSLIQFNFKNFCSINQIFSNAILNSSLNLQSNFTIQNSQDFFIDEYNEKLVYHKTSCIDTNTILANRISFLYFNYLTSNYFSAKPNYNTYYLPVNLYDSNHYKKYSFSNDYHNYNFLIENTRRYVKQHSIISIVDEFNQSCNETKIYRSPFHKVDFISGNLRAERKFYNLTHIYYRIYLNSIWKSSKNLSLFLQYEKFNFSYSFFGYFSCGDIDFCGFAQNNLITIENITNYDSDYWKVYGYVDIFVISLLTSLDIYFYPNHEYRRIQNENNAYLRYFLRYDSFEVLADNYLQDNIFNITPSKFQVVDLLKNQNNLQERFYCQPIALSKYYVNRNCQFFLLSNQEASFGFYVSINSEDLQMNSLEFFRSKIYINVFNSSSLSNVNNFNFDDYEIPGIFELSINFKMNQILKGLLLNNILIVQVKILENIEFFKNRSIKSIHLEEIKESLKEYTKTTYNQIVDLSDVKLVDSKSLTFEKIFKVENFYPNSYKIKLCAWAIDNYGLKSEKMCSTYRNLLQVFQTVKLLPKNVIIKYQPDFYYNYLFDGFPSTLQVEFTSESNKKTSLSMKLEYTEKLIKLEAVSKSEWRNLLSNDNSFSFRFVDKFLFLSENVGDYLFYSGSDQLNVSLKVYDLVYTNETVIVYFNYTNDIQIRDCFLGSYWDIIKLKCNQNNVTINRTLISNLNILAIEYKAFEFDKNFTLYFYKIYDYTPLSISNTSDGKNFLTFRDSITVNSNFEFTDCRIGFYGNSINFIYSAYSNYYLNDNYMYCDQSYEVFLTESVQYFCNFRYFSY